MLEQWHADQLLHMPKVYSRTMTVELAPGVHDDYPVESSDGNEHFLFDVYRSLRNPRKASFELRYGRVYVIARLCTSASHLHTNPDGSPIGSPHLHEYREGENDKWANKTREFDDMPEALAFFCKHIHLPIPDIQGGLT
jgi:hypothetical protein